MAEISWAEMLIKYKGLWVALRDKDVDTWVTVVATGKTFDEAEENAKKNGYPDPRISFIQEKNTLWIGPWYEIELSEVRPPKEI